jgi:cell division septation protein DedD
LAIWPAVRVPRTRWNRLLRRRSLSFQRRSDLPRRPTPGSMPATATTRPPAHRASQSKKKVRRPCDTPTPPDSAPSDTPPPLPKDNSAPSSPAPADPDFEHVTKPAVPESGQQGVGRAPDSSGKAQYRVQTGAYTDEGNARSVSDQLRGEGYTTSTRSERQGDHLVYKVQAGAYRSKNGANRAAVDLQKKGFPAYVSPLTP